MTMLNTKTPDRFVLAYIAARRTERTLDQTRVLARQWRDHVSVASNEGYDVFAVEALQRAQRYNTTVSHLSQLLEDQEAEIERLHIVDVFDY
jgi:phage shock protein A